MSRIFVSLTKAYIQCFMNVNKVAFKHFWLKKPKLIYK